MYNSIDNLPLIWKRQKNLLSYMPNKECKISLCLWVKLHWYSHEQLHPTSSDKTSYAYNIRHVFQRAQNMYGQAMLTWTGQTDRDATLLTRNAYH